MAVIKPSTSESKWTSIIDELYAPINASEVSILARRHSFVMGDQSFIYGDIDTSSFIQLLHRCSLPQGAHFVDLGSGSGKACCCAATHPSLDRIQGIEFLEPLHKLACQQTAAFCHRVSDEIEWNVSDSLFDMRHGDIKDLGWIHANVVFLNGACFTDEMMNCIHQGFSSLHDHSTIITINQPIDRAEFELKFHQPIGASWGDATAYIYQKRPHK